MRLKDIALCLLAGVLQLQWRPANALIREQVAFDDSDVCWWSLTPPNSVCPVLSQQNLTEMVNKLAGQYGWTGGDECEGEYCLYANKGFAGGRGISLITTHDNYLRVRAVGDLLQEYEVSFNEDMDFLPFHVAEVEGKGDGIVADSKLKRGDPIMAHTPVLLVHRAFREDLPEPRQHALLDAAVDALPSATAEVFTRQMAHVPGQHRVAAILTTNAFQVDLDPSGGGVSTAGHHYGSFPEAAKMNHDCRPNAVFHVDPTTLMHITSAVTTITPGTEITLSYLDPLGSRAERQARARAAWGFGCTCSRCAASASASGPEDGEAQADANDDSETRLKEIAWIEGKLADPDSFEVSPGLITYLLGLYENERLLCCLSGVYSLAATNFNMLGYDMQAAMYAEHAIAALKMEKGEGAPDIAAMEELRRDPKAHFTWGARKKRSRSSASAATGAAPVTPT